MTNLVFCMLLACLLMFFAGFIVGRFRGESQNARSAKIAAARALAARIAVGKALPALDTIEAISKEDWPNEREDARNSLHYALHLLRALTWGTGRYWQHLKRGTTYEVLTYHLNLQASDLKLLHDDAELVLYIDTRSGRLSTRHPLEFHDGRFKRIARDKAFDLEETTSTEGEAPEHADDLFASWGRSFRRLLQRDRD